MKLPATPIIAAALGLLGLAGCTSGETGLVRARRTFTQHALLVDSYTLGAGLSLHPDTAGTTLGYGHTTYFFARQPGDPAPSVEKWTLFHTPLPDRTLLAVAATKAGLDLAANRSAVGFNLGLESSFAQRLPVYESTILQLRYHPQAPSETIVEIHQPKKP